jgi:hypothetical protein
MSAGAVVLLWPRLSQMTSEWAGTAQLARATSMLAL